MNSKIHQKNASTNLEIAEQTYWVNQVKSNPEQFKSYIGKSLANQDHLRDMFNSGQAYGDNSSNSK